MTMQATLSRSFWGTRAPDSLRKSGYKNAAYALGELVDNSIQEGANDVDIIVVERKHTLGAQKRFQIAEIAVLDNGNGMDPETLSLCLALGEGTRAAKKGMGKFGVGLPQASISQCQRVIVWSWQEGIASAQMTEIDLTDPGWITQGCLIPKPINKEIPARFLGASDIWKTEDSGTLVVWQEIDRCQWKTAKYLFKHSEHLIGRMYRNWLHDEASTPVSIRLLRCEVPPHKVKESYHFESEGSHHFKLKESHYFKPKESYCFKPNDPLYLQRKTSVTPAAPVDPMFKPWGEPIEMKFEVGSPDGPIPASTVLTFSIAYEETRFGPAGDIDGGKHPWGKHAEQNRGVSIVREGRELELDTRWLTTSNHAYERWWGAEVSFGREMDDVFDVTNNKQHAQRLSDVANKSWEDYQEDEGESQDEIEKRLKESEPQLWFCLKIAHRIRGVLNQLRTGILHTARRDRKTKGRHDDADAAQARGTKIVKDRTKGGHTGISDSEEQLPAEKRKQLLKQNLKAQGTDDDEIDRLLPGIDLGYKFQFQDKPLDTEAFFSVEPKAGILYIVRNQNHSAYRTLFSTLSGDPPDNLKDAIVQRRKANRAILLLLEAWARLEDEQQMSGQKGQAKNLRRAWGTIAAEFLEGEDD